MRHIACTSLRPCLQAHGRNQPGAQHSPAPDPTGAQAQAETIRRQFEAIRFGEDRPRTDRPIDLLMGFWLTLLYHGRNSHNSLGRRRALQEANRFWHASGFQPVLYRAGETAGTLVYEQLLDAAQKYYRTCREDPYFGSRFFRLVRLTPEQIAEKAAAETAELIFDYWLRVDSLDHRQALFQAAWFAFAPAFPDHPQALVNHMKQAPGSVREALALLLGVVL